MSLADSKLDENANFEVNEGQVAFKDEKEDAVMLISATTALEQTSVAHSSASQNDNSLIKEELITNNTLVNSPEVYKAPKENAPNVERDIKLNVVKVGLEAADQKLVSDGMKSNSAVTDNSKTDLVFDEGLALNDKSLCDAKVDGELPGYSKVADGLLEEFQVDDVLTESMLLEEKHLISETDRLEEETIRCENERRMMNKEQDECYNRLKSLLMKSRLYTSFISKRMQEQREKENVVDSNRVCAAANHKQQEPTLERRLTEERERKQQQQDSGKEKENCSEMEKAVSRRGTRSEQLRQKPEIQSRRSCRLMSNNQMEENDCQIVSSPRRPSTQMSMSSSLNSSPVTISSSSTSIVSVESDPSPPGSNRKRGRAKKNETLPAGKRQKLTDSASNSLAAYVAAAVGDTKDNISGSNQSREAAESWDQPALLTGGTLRPYQIDGFKWLKMLCKNGVNGILADEMGLGKTVQCIALICELIVSKVDGPFLICAPLSTIPNWIHEMSKFAPMVPHILYHGTKNDRAMLRPGILRQHPLKVTIGGVNGSEKCFKTAPVVITSYEIAMQDRPFIAGYSWKMLIVDEGHRIKNKNCRLIRELRLYNSQHRLLLTGTPLQNNMAELWSLLNFLIPEIFDNLSSFETWFDVQFLETVSNAEEQIVLEEQKKHTLSMLHQILAPFMLRRLKTDVAVSIPPKREMLVYAPLTLTQHNIYRSVVDKTIASLLEKPAEPEPEIGANGRPIRKSRSSSINYNLMIDNDEEEDGNEDVAEKKQEEGKHSHKRKRRIIHEDDDDDVSLWAESLIGAQDKRAEELKALNAKEVKPIGSVIHITLRNVLAMLRRCCNHPYLIEYPLKDDGQFRVDEQLVSSCGKLALLDQMLFKLHANGHKKEKDHISLDHWVKCKMTSMLDILEDYCHLRHYEFSRLDGSMKITDRQEQIERYNRKDVFIFLLSTRAGGLGINLIQADTVIIYDSDWNPQCDLQAQDRCHRIGQTRPVVVYRLVASNTVDQKIVERASAKRKLEKMVIHKGKFKSCQESFQAELLPLNATELLNLLHETDEISLTSGMEAGTISDSDLNQLLDRSDLYRRWTSRADGQALIGTDVAQSSVSPVSETGGKLFEVVNEVWGDEVLAEINQDGASSSTV